MKLKQLRFCATFILSITLSIQYAFAISGGKCDYIEYTEDFYGNMVSTKFDVDDSGHGTPAKAGSFSWNISHDQSTNTNIIKFQDDEAGDFLKDLKTIESMKTTKYNGYTIQPDWSAKREYNISDPYLLEHTQQYISHPKPSSYDTNIDEEVYTEDNFSLKYSGQYKIVMVPESKKLASFNFLLKYNDEIYPSSYEYKINIDTLTADKFITISNEVNAAYYIHTHLVLNNCTQIHKKN